MKKTLNWCKLQAKLSTQHTIFNLITDIVAIKWEECGAGILHANNHRQMTMRKSRTVNFKKEEILTERADENWRKKEEEIEPKSMK